jgi:hypothetical protein
MTFSYEVLESGYVLRSDGCLIPNDPANSDYQAYLNKDNPDWNTPTL